MMYHIKAGAYGDFPDVSSCDKLKLTVKTNDKVAYAGYRMGFGLKTPPHSMPYAHGFKAHFDAPEGDDFEEVIIPFNEFSDNWSPYTGDQTITCAENSIYCPDDETLTNMHELSLMAEGVGGEVDLVIKTIHAIGCKVDSIDSFDDSNNSNADPNPSIVTNGEIIIETFDNPTLKWVEMSDPVMGGQSYGSFTVQDGLGVLTGEVVDVPFLAAPGFIKIDGMGKFPDVSSCKKLKLTVKTNDEEEYKGYRCGFGTKTPPDTMPYIHGFKANFNVVATDDFQHVIIPFDEFSDKWDGATGEQTVTCADNNDYCPDTVTLADMHEFNLWAEGVDGKVNLIVKSISAIECDGMKNPNVGNPDGMVLIEDFSSPRLQWTQKNDPVMGVR